MVNNLSTFPIEMSVSLQHITDSLTVLRLSKSAPSHTAVIQTVGDHLHKMADSVQLGKRRGNAGDVWEW